MVDLRIDIRLVDVSTKLRWASARTASCGWSTFAPAIRASSPSGGHPKYDVALYADYVA